MADLLGHVSDLVEGIRQEAVCLQEVEGAEGEQLEGDANVAVVAEPVQHLHAVADGQKKRNYARDETEASPSLVRTHFLLSGSLSLIVSRTLISSLAASLYFSRFLMIFRATGLPPLSVKTTFHSERLHLCIISFATGQKNFTCCGPNTAPPSRMFPPLKCRLSHLKSRL